VRRVPRRVHRAQLALVRRNRITAGKSAGSAAPDDGVEQPGERAGAAGVIRVLVREQDDGWSGPDGRSDSLEMRWQGGAGIDDGDPTATDQVGAGAVERHGRG